MLRLGMKAIPPELKEKIREAMKNLASLRSTRMHFCIAPRGELNGHSIADVYGIIRLENQDWKIPEHELGPPPPRKRKDAGSGAPRQQRAGRNEEQGTRTLPTAPSNDVPGMGTDRDPTTRTHAEYEAGINGPDPSKNIGKPGYDADGRMTIEEVSRRVSLAMTWGHTVAETVPPEANTGQDQQAIASDAQNCQRVQSENHGEAESANASDEASSQETEGEPEAGAEAVANVAEAEAKGLGGATKSLGGPVEMVGPPSGKPWVAQGPEESKSSVCNKTAETGGVGGESRQRATEISPRGPSPDQAKNGLASHPSRPESGSSGGPGAGDPGRGDAEEDEMGEPKDGIAEIDAGERGLGETEESSEQQENATEETSDQQENATEESSEAENNMKNSEEQKMAYQPAKENCRGFTEEEEAVWMAGRVIDERNVAVQMRDARREREGAERLRQQWEDSEEGRAFQQLAKSFAACRKLLAAQPEAAERAQQHGHPRYDVYAKLKENLDKANQAPRCCYPKTSGELCKAPKMKGHQYCNMHVTMTAKMEQEFEIPALDDANSIQATITNTARRVAKGKLDEKTAMRLAYILQLAVTNVTRVDFEPPYEDEIRGS